MIITNDLIKEATIQVQSNIGNKLALDAGNKNSYPGTGSTWFDISGNNNNATFISAATFSNGSFNFNGISNYAVVQSSPSLNVIGFNVSFEVWATNNLFTENNNYARFPIFKGPYNGGDQGFAGNYGFWIIAENPGSPEIQSKLYLRFGSNNGVAGEVNRDMSGIYNFTPGVFNQFFITQDSNGFKFYINGSFVSAGTNADLLLGADASNLLIGKRSDNWGYMDGKIAIINIWDKKLSDADILTNYNFYSSRFNA